MNLFGRPEAAGATPLGRWHWKIGLGEASNGLPLALGRRQFCLDHPDERAAGLVEGLGQFEDRGERWLLLTQFEDAHVGAAQVGLKAKPLLRQTGLQAQLTKNFPEGDCWLQISLLLLEELGRKDMIMSSHSCRNSAGVQPYDAFDRSQKCLDSLSEKTK